MQLHERTMREFLHDHPEHIPGTRRTAPGEHPDFPAGGELVMNTDTLIAFTDWTIRTGRGDPKKARGFRQLLRDRFGK